MDKFVKILFDNTEIIRRVTVDVPLSMYHYHLWLVHLHYS